MFVWNEVICLGDSITYGARDKYGRSYPVELSNSQIAKLTGSTKNTVDAIRTGTYREAVLESKSPMDIGLCTYEELEKSLNRSRKKNINLDAKD